MLEEFGIDYLTKRGITPQFAQEQGVDETPPTPEIIKDRLNFRPNGQAFAEVRSLLWFPVGVANYVARINGSYRDIEGNEVRFLFSKNGRRVPWVPQVVLDVAKDVGKPLIFTESYFRSLAILHAGGLPIGFNGPWINEKTAPKDGDKPNNRVLVAELADFRWKTRRIYFFFDLDQAINGQVRHAVVRAWIILKVAGADVYQVQWDKQNKGIDDHLAQTCGTDQALQKTELDRLLASAKPFVEMLEKGSGGDARYVRQELHKVKMDVTDREAFAKEMANPLGVTKASLLCVEGSKKPVSSRKVTFEDPEPWGEPVNGNQLLGDIIALINKHILISPADAVTVALWIYWTYLVNEDYVEVSPYLGVTSPDKGCAKTRILNLIELLVWRGYGLSSLTPSSFFRFVEEYHPTLCIDEFHKLVKNRSELLQPFLNAYSRGKPVLLTNTESMEIEAFDIWGARAVAYLEKLDDQLRDRVIEINLERKPRSVKKPKLRETPKEYTEELRRKLLRWARDNAGAVGDAVVPVFETDNDRAEDNWELLFRIATVIDPDGVDAVVQIAVAKEASPLAERASEQDAVLKGVRAVYQAVCDIHGDEFNDPKIDFFLSLSTICTVMNQDKHGPWQNWKWGSEYGAHPERISRILTSYVGQKPKRSRDEESHGLPGVSVPTTNTRGYWLSELRAKFEQYVK
jgi:Domain of unknown function (DUF3854)/Protein of unknown function (DUF3631)